MRIQEKQNADREEGGLNAVANGLVGTGSPEPGLPEYSTAVGHHEPLYLFACHVEWSHRQNLGAHQELVAALDDSDQGIRALAETMLHRCSPRP